MTLVDIMRAIRYTRSQAAANGSVRQGNEPSIHEAFNIITEHHPEDDKVWGKIASLFQVATGAQCILITAYECDHTFLECQDMLAVATISADTVA